MDAAQNEVRIVRYNTPFLRYRIHQVDSKGDQIRDVYESKDGTVARLIARDGHVLSAEQDAAERQRLTDMLDDPDAFARHVRGDVQGKKTAVELIGYMPDAMLYSYAPGQPQRGPVRPEDGPEIVLDFAPNPDWKAPTLAADALTGLSGRMWINARTRVLGRMEGHIVRPVNFGWGVFARINPGGELLLEQVRISNERTIFSRFSQNVTARALMVKSIKVNSSIEASQYTPVAAVSYQDAIRALLATPLPDR